MTALTRKFVEAAAAGLMKTAASIGRKTMVCKLPAKARKDVLFRLAAKGKVLDGTSLSFDLFGPHQPDFLHQVVRPRNKLRTYIYENTLPMQGTDQRLIPVARIPDFLQDVADLVKAAEAGLDAFMPHYEAYAEEGRRAADHNIRESGVQASTYMKYPTAEEFRAAFYIDISPPEPLPVIDLERFGSLPADMAGKIADANAERLAAQLDAAKRAAMDEAHAQMETVAKQLSSGKRLHASLISNSKRVARMLRDMVENYDRDPALLEYADMIEEKIASVPSTDTWNDIPSRRKESAAAAKKIASGIKTITKAADKAAKVEKKAAAKAGDVVMGGILGDLM